MSLRKPEMVLFDLDGTLVDSVPDLANSIDLMLEHIGLPRRGENRIRNWVGSGIDRLVKRALADDMDVEPDEELFQKALPVFMDFYRENTCIRSRVYDGVLDALNFLKLGGYKLGCVTNKRKQFTDNLLKALGIFHDFDIVLSGDSLVRMKPDPMPLLHAAEKFAIKPENVLMIGDSVNDVKAARAAGMQVLCVSYGYNLGRDIRDARPDVIVDSLAELTQLI